MLSSHCSPSLKCGSTGFWSEPPERVSQPFWRFTSKKKGQRAKYLNESLSLRHTKSRWDLLMFEEETEHSVSLQQVKKRMPRPGPRPYDCVRRAWHSDRHQHIRGTLIQEIFRVVGEIHNSTTKKNREYQEKLPVVVLRAEKIMYSKANSEAEYIDLSTLLERTNDAISTIIRLDESTEETGEYIQPCIEAALCLGCSPKKASRSQRNNPGYYLSPGKFHEPPTVSHNTGHNSAEGKHTTRPHYVSNCSNFDKTTSLTSTHLGNRCFELPPTSDLFSSYPMYYGNHGQFGEHWQGSKISPHQPIFMGGVQKHLSCNSNASRRRAQSFRMINPDNPYAIGCDCDLSLRLGPVSMLAPTDKDGQLQAQARSKFSAQTSQKDESFSYFGTLGCFPNKCSSKGESSAAGHPIVQKRKAELVEAVKNQKFFLRPE